MLWAQDLQDIPSHQQLLQVQVQVGISGETSTPPLLPFLCVAVKKWNRDTAIAAQSSTQDVWLACFKVRLFDDLLLLLLNAKHSNNHQCSHAMLPSSVPWWGQPISPAWPTAPKLVCLKSVCLRRPVGSCRHTEGIAAAIPVWVHAAPTARRLPVHSPHSTGLGSGHSSRAAGRCEPGGLQGITGVSSFVAHVRMRPRCLDVFILCYTVLGQVSCYHVRHSLQAAAGLCMSSPVQDPSDQPPVAQGQVPVDACVG